MIAPGYYSQECNVHKPCPDPTKYCHMFLCVDCLKENVACTQNGQCCPGTECTYGRCKKASSKGAAGMYVLCYLVGDAVKIYGVAVPGPSTGGRMGLFSPDQLDVVPDQEFFSRIIQLLILSYNNGWIFISG